MDTKGSNSRPHCCACGHPLRTGEPHWAGDRQGRAWHYGCAEKAGLTYSWFNLRAVREAVEEVALGPSPSPAGSAQAL